ncbi:MAG: alpha/beta hydrolase [Clostridia bacterium]|nr:alpha/beta hydrolase [Clostridia bacterium]
MPYLIIALVLIFLVIAPTLISFFTCFYHKQRPPKEEFEIPEGDIYLPHKMQMVAWMKQARSLPHEEITITSYDGLKLYGKYYQCNPGGIIELMFHGYRGNSERDLCGGIERCFKLGHNVLMVDQRACGKSEGRVITFGVKESRDCKAWIDYTVARFGKDVRILLCGVSMGASTVMMAAGREMPENVIGVLADCGYSSQREIIRLVTKNMKLPPKFMYLYIKLSASLLGGFNIDEYPPIQALKNCKVPVMIIHGEADDFVPCYMAQECYDACASRKCLVTIPNAGHGLAYMIAPDKYIASMKEFFE